METMVPEGRPHKRPFQFHLKELWNFSLVIGHPPSLVRDHFSSPRVVANPSNVMKCADHHPKTTLYKSLETPKMKVGAQVSTKGLWSDRDIEATHKCSGVEGSFSGPEKVQGPVPKPKCVGCYRQPNRSSLHKQQGGTHLVEMRSLLWKIMT